VRELVELLFAARSPYLTGVLSVLRSGDGVVAADFSLRSREVLGLWFPAFCPETSRYSTGAIRTLRTIEEAAKLGVAELDLGKGDESYKSAFANGSYDVVEAALERRKLGTYVRRVRQAPNDYVIPFILEHPRSRQATRRTLRRFGKVRVRVGR
jgi:CelD/BcsL family acetyltransferase involved in cellulose biosynthesis